MLHDVSFEAYGGQILGVAGLVGRGPHGDDARDLRRGSAGFRQDLRQGQGSAHPPAKGRHPRRHRLPHRGPQGSGIGALSAVQTKHDPRQHAPVQERAVSEAPPDPRQQRERVYALRIKTPTIDEVVAQLSRRQPAEGGHRASGSTPRRISTSLTNRRAASTSARRSRSTNVMNDLVRQGKCVIMVSSGDAGDPRHERPRAGHARRAGDGGHRPRFAALQSGGHHESGLGR